MIRPTKYTNVDLSVIGLSAEILEILKKDYAQKYNQILGKIIDRKGKEAKSNFLLALSFLFLLGKIKYYPKSDVIELLLIEEMS